MEIFRSQGIACEVVGKITGEPALTLQQDGNERVFWRAGD